MKIRSCAKKSTLTSIGVLITCAIVYAADGNQNKNGGSSEAQLGVNDISGQLSNEKCDLQLEFIAPVGNIYVFGNSGITPVKVQAKNVGTQTCNSQKIILLRYKGRQGFAVGGMANSTRQLKSLKPQRTHTFTWDVIAPEVDKEYKYAARIIGNYSDYNNSNHKPYKRLKHHSAGG